MVLTLNISLQNIRLQISFICYLMKNQHKCQAIIRKKIILKEIILLQILNFQRKFLLYSYTPSSDKLSYIPGKQGRTRQIRLVFTYIRENIDSYVLTTMFPLIKKGKSISESDDQQKKVKMDRLHLASTEAQPKKEINEQRKQQKSGENKTGPKTEQLPNHQQKYKTVSQTKNKENKTQILSQISTLQGQDNKNINQNTKLNA